MCTARSLSFSSPKDPGEATEAWEHLMVAAQQQHSPGSPLVHAAGAPHQRVARSLSSALAVCGGQQQQDAISSFLDSRERMAAGSPCISPGRHMEAAPSKVVCSCVSPTAPQCSQQLQGYAVLTQTMPISPPFYTCRR